MGFKCGIVGLPNVGKSTLFNALTQTAAAQAANYPFCTIEPNVGDVAVPDPRLATLAKIAASKEIIPTRLSFVDIAGLVRGASKGEGLGNQFLANIRECEAIAHVVRCFDDGDVTHVEGRIDPLSDIATIETELMLADLESLERRAVQMEKKAKGGDKEAKELLALAERSLSELKEGRPARAALVGRDERRAFESLGLLLSMSATSTKPPPTAATPIPIRSRIMPPRKTRPRSLCRRRLRAKSPCCLRPSRRPISRPSD
jgi:ribosome-binding ATPase